MTTLFQRILGRQRLNPEESKPPLNSPRESAPKNDQPGNLHSLDWVFGSAQSVGRYRTHNEDALFTFGSHLAYQDKQKFTGFFVVADGMGGHANGELASSLAIQSITGHVLKSITAAHFSAEPGPDLDAIKQLILEGVQEANQAVKEQVPGGGTTLTALLIVQDYFFVAHVGDSRAYWLVPNEEPRVLTHDHSFVRQLVELGQISEEEAAVHPKRNILSMALGQWEPVEPDVVTDLISEPGHFLLCSDGLWGVVPSSTISHIINTQNDIQQACLSLVDAANQAGGPDNITVVLIRTPNKR